MTTDGAPGDGSVEPRTIPMPRPAPDDLRDDDTRELPPVRDDGARESDEGVADDVAEVVDVARVDADPHVDVEAYLTGDPHVDVEAYVTGDLHVDGEPDVTGEDVDGEPDDEAEPVDREAAEPVSRRPFLPSAPAAPGSDVDTPRVYADGSALSRYLAGAPAREAWLAWAGAHEAELVTTPLGITELRRIAQPRGLEARGTALEVGGRIEVARFSDQTLRKASKVSAVLPPFVALHLGAALAHPGVTAIATYDRQLAQVATLYGLTVVSPGWPDRWWERDA